VTRTCDSICGHGEAPSAELLALGPSSVGDDQVYNLDLVDKVHHISYAPSHGYAITGSADMVLLRVREAARELDVHEDTIGRWEEAGIVRAVHLAIGLQRTCGEGVPCGYWE
jgi:hypothetical protein